MCQKGTLLSLKSCRNSKILDVRLLMSDVRFRPILTYDPIGLTSKIIYSFVFI